MTDALLATLIDEHAALEAFAALLACEAKALGAVSPLETLPSIIEKKTALTERLASLEKARDARLHELGLPPGRQGMTLAIAADLRLAEYWKQLLTMAQRARRANTNNGLMICVRMNYNQSALAILRGATQNASLYGPNGRMATR